MNFIKNIENQYKGKKGEFKVSLLSNLFLSSKRYIVLNNVMLESKGRTAQIDHIIVSIYGIFVIETKNYVGNIYGNETSKIFTQFAGNKKNQFYSPIQQNEKHVRVLREVIKNNIPFYNLVVFGNDATLKVETNHCKVINQNQMISAIKSKHTPIIDETMMQMIAQRILYHNIVDKDMRKQHVRDIKNYKK